MAVIEIEKLKKVYTGGKVAVEDFSLKAEGGEFVVLLGPTGSGKTAVLRTICGLDEIDGGEIKADGVVINNALPKDRDMSVVFKNIGLYPSLTVYDNIAFGLKVRKFPKEEIDKRVDYVSKFLGLDFILNKKPKMLTAIERTRVTFARAIVRQAKVILIDDPLSGYDAETRAFLRNDILKIQQRLSVNVIYATKDAAEALTLADRIVYMEEGRIVQIGTPEEIYLTPKTVSLALYCGSPKINLIEGKIASGAFKAGDITVETSIADNHRAYLAVRPENVVFDGDINATVKSCKQVGEDRYLLNVAVEGVKDELVALSENALDGEVKIGFENTLFYDAKTEERI